jgi:hypothetical protein
VASLSYNNSRNLRYYCKKFVNDLITPLYFSAISISTIGFGDFSPQTAEGKAAVILDVFFGIFLFVVVLQKAMATDEKVPG